jgi:hypothetical protein
MSLVRRINSAMSEARKPAKQTKPGGREARLAAALRENLRRRKAQERGRDAQAEDGSDRTAGDPASGDENP